MSAVPHPEYQGVYCPTCEHDCLPLSNGRCGFCDTLVQPRDTPPLGLVAPPKEEPTGINRAVLSRIEQGRLVPTAREQRLIAACLAIDAGRLATRTYLVVEDAT